MRKLTKRSPYLIFLIYRRGIEYQLAGNTSLLLTVFFKNGFTDITKNYAGGFTDKTSLKNLGLSIGFMF